MNVCVVCSCRVKLDNTVYTNNHLPTCGDDHADVVNGEVRASTPVPTVLDYERFCEKQNRRHATLHAFVSRFNRAA